MAQWLTTRDSQGNENFQIALSNGSVFNNISYPTRARGIIVKYKEI